MVKCSPPARDQRGYPVHSPEATKSRHDSGTTSAGAGKGLGGDLRSGFGKMILEQQSITFFQAWYLPVLRSLRVASGIGGYCVVQGPCCMH